MAAVKQTGTLLSALGANVTEIKKAHEAAKDAPISWGMQNLPPGINGGIAELKTVEWNKFKTDAKNVHHRNQPYVLFRGIAKIPKEHNGCPVEGLGVMQTIPLCNQPDRKGPTGEPKTVQDAWAELLNELKKFGVDTSTTTPNEIEGILAGLQEQKPLFRFSTISYTPKPTALRKEPTAMTITNFLGLYEPNGDGAVPGEEPHGEVGSPADSDTVDNSAVVNGGDPNADGALDDQLLELGVAADGGDEPAIATLTATALAAGWTEEQLIEADSWSEIAAALLSQADDAAAAAKVEPKKGLVFKYQVIDPKTNEPALNKLKKPVAPVQVEITQVDKKNNTVTALNLVDRKTVYKLVPWNSLLPSVS